MLCIIIFYVGRRMKCYVTGLARDRVQFLSLRYELSFNTSRARCSASGTRRVQENYTFEVRFSPPLTTSVREMPHLELMKRTQSLKGIF